MLLKWKNILLNWINCYFTEPTQAQDSINLESLLNIICHLRKNFSLDESKSSLLEAHTLEAFVIEKYPQFQFENGSNEAVTEDDIHIAASLLLFFVCVNSKDMDIKSAMCNKLSTEDQEIILKFSKCLLECSAISYQDVQSSIAEACGHHIAINEGGQKQLTIAETPPALRSLHGEVRRLQAALDAERFDRNYLQEELSRTNMKLEKFKKDKEQHKLEIINLKAKISMCCGQEEESRCMEANSEASIRLEKQLQQLEDKLVETQGLLEDVQSERNLYESKVDEIKRERDKWATLTQQETLRACQLTEELDLERRQVASLQEIVTELRQHNRLNNLDNSNLECDDPDTSIHLPHNSSVCSEACANVIEVQLGEEKAKNSAFLQQIQSLQEQLNNLTQKYELEMNSYGELLTVKDNEIFSLKHRINEEIEEKNNIKSQFNCEVTTLNNKMNELEQNIKDNNDRSTKLINSKIREIQLLQEEKLSLLQSLSDETTKQEILIKNLKKDLELEKSQQLKMKNDYEIQIMKLNDKVLNRNNELVELQNNVFEKSEKIESLQLELKNEKEVKEDLSNRCNNEIVRLNEHRITIENNLHVATVQCDDLQKELDQKVKLLEDSNAKIHDLEISNWELNNSYQFLEEERNTMLNKLRDRDNKIVELKDAIKTLQNSIIDESEKFKHDIDEKDAFINTLNSQLQNEIQYKLELQNKVHYLQSELTEVKTKINKVNTALSQVNKEKDEKAKLMEQMNLSLNEEKSRYEELKLNNESLKEDILSISEQLNLKLNEIQSIGAQFSYERQSFLEKIAEKNSLLELANEKILNESTEKNNVVEKYGLVCEEIENLRAENEGIAKELDEKKRIGEELEEKLQMSKVEYAKLQNNFETEVSKLLSRLSETDKHMKDFKSKSKNILEDKELQIKTLNIDIENLLSNVANETEKTSIIEQEKELLVHKLEEELIYKNKFEKEYQNQCCMLKDITDRLTGEIVMKNNEIQTLKEDAKTLTETIQQKSSEMKTIEEKLLEELKMSKDIQLQQNFTVNNLLEKVHDIETIKEDLQQELNKEILNKTKVIEALQKENEMLHFTIEEENSNHEVFLKEKDSLIESLENQLKVITVQLESLQKKYECERFKWDKFSVEMHENFVTKEEKVQELNKQIVELKNSLEEKVIDIEKVREHYDRKIEEITNEKANMEKKLKNEYMCMEADLAIEHAQTAVTAQEKDKLISELIAEKLVLETGQKSLVEQINFISQQLSDENLAKVFLIEEKDNLLIEKSTLAQELLEQKSVRNILEKEKDNAISENSHMVLHFIDELQKYKAHNLEEKTSLINQLLEEKLCKEFLEKEKDHLNSIKIKLEKELDDKMLAITNIEQEKEKLITEIEQLTAQLHEKQAKSEALKNENEVLVQQLREEKTSKDAICLIRDNLAAIAEKQNIQLEDQHTIHEVLRQEKELLIAEKQTLETYLKEEKSSHDQLISQKNDLFESNSIFREQIAANHKKAEKIAEQLEEVQNHCKQQDETNSDIVSSLTNGLEKLLEKLKKEDIGNDVLRKLIMDNKSMEVRDNCDLLVNVADNLITDLCLRKNLEKALEHENAALNDMREVISQKEMQIHELQGNMKDLEHALSDSKTELAKQTEILKIALESKTRDINSMQLQNKNLNIELNDIKVQLEVKVHSLKEKLVDSENLTDKLKKTYECQIENLNVMVNKLTNYLKDKTVELDLIKKEKERLQHIIEDNNTVIRTLENEIKSHKQNQSKLLTDFESERLVLKNMVTVTESVMEDQKLTFDNTLAEHVKSNNKLTEEIKSVKELLENERQLSENKLQEKEIVIKTVYKELSDLKTELETHLKTNQMLTEDIKLFKVLLEKEKISKESEIEAKQVLDVKLFELKSEMTKCVTDSESLRVKLVEEISSLHQQLQSKEESLQTLKINNNELADILQKYKEDITSLEVKNIDLKNEMNTLKVDTKEKIDMLTIQLNELEENKHKFNEQIYNFNSTKASLEQENIDLKSKIVLLTQKENEELIKLKKDNIDYLNNIEDKKSVIHNLEQLVKQELEQNHKMRNDNDSDKLNLQNKCFFLQEYKDKAEKALTEQQIEINSLKKECDCLKAKVESFKTDFKLKEDNLSTMTQEKDAIINIISKELNEEKAARENCLKELELKTATLHKLKHNLQEQQLTNDVAMKAFKKENEQLVKSNSPREIYAVCQEKHTSYVYSSVHTDKERDTQVDISPTSDLTQSSLESIKTISDLEKIIHDRNRTITTLQSDITYIKTLMAESENKLLDVTNELEMSKENCHQLSSQLKKIVHQKNEEIADLRKQVNKMSATESRASQIIKLSAKYHAIIDKRIAEIKSNTVLKELTNFGNLSNGNNDLKRSMHATITMEDLENFLDTTDRHMKKCSEKQISLQKERDRLIEVNRINDSEIINLKKFLTELSVSFKTFTSVKELYGQKLSIIISMQRTVRREILNLDGHITEATMCKLERGYAATMQDLSECALNLERWVERSISRTISPEKIKQAFTSENERVSLSSTSFQHASLEVQLEELQGSFHRLLEEVSKAQMGESARDKQAETVMEVRAEYEDKLNRMKAKMKQLYQEQMQVFREKQKEEMEILEIEVQKARDNLAESSRKYEEHIKALTTELWSMGEKFLMKKDEAEWLKKKQHTGSLMSLQHVHSTGLVPPKENSSRASDTHSLRSLPLNSNAKNEGRTLHMSDEEGEVFDNRWLKELSETPPSRPSVASRGRSSQVPRSPQPPGLRLSELRWRNSLCPPHLKSSYPAETQFTPTLEEEDIKCAENASLCSKQQRKEVGITAYKKPGPPTPSKQAGRLSATDSELRESLRVEMEPQPSFRKTSTPSRLRALFRPNKNDTAEGTPRNRRLSFFKKK